MQGLLGNCYFLSVLSVLAERENRIKKLFITDKPNKFGLYAVKFFKNGEEKEIVVDDMIACYRGEPAFSKSHGDELWVILLEKAWAKVHGCFERIEAGFAENVMADLTGAPTEVIETEEENIFERLKEGDAKGWIMAASAGSTEASKEALEDLGLVGNHSYGLIGVVDVIDIFGDTVQLVKLRNPWGEFEWKGDWGDDSDCWTPVTKEQANWTDEDDGTFFMCVNDLRRFFSRVQMCHVNDNYKHKHFKARHKHGDFSLITF